MQNKYAYHRYRVIDRCLQNRQRLWTWRELAEECGIEIRDNYRDDSENPSERTIKKDIADMNSLFGDVVELDGESLIKFNRNKSSYEYSIPNFSITQHKLTIKERKSLEDAVDILKQFKDLPVLEPFSETIGKISLAIQDHFNDDDNVIIFEKILQTSKVKIFINDFVNIANAKAMILLKYYPFFNFETKTIKFHTYQICEHNNRWFVLGWNFTDSKILSVPLDRIVSKSLTNTKYNRNEFFKVSDFYGDMIGVTYTSNDVERVVVSATPSQGIFLKARPFHSSQKVLIDNETEFRIELNVRVNKDLITELCSCEDTINVIEPEHLAKKLKEIYQNALLKYNSFI